MFYYRVKIAKISCFYHVIVADVTQSYLHDMLHLTGFYRLLYTFQYLMHIVENYLL
jgi:hypothetical protein